jgi:elongation factor G
MPCMCFFNKMDRNGSNFYKCIDDVKTMPETVPLILQLPIGAEKNFLGVFNLVDMTAVIWDNAEL